MSRRTVVACFLQHRNHKHLTTRMNNQHAPDIKPMIMRCGATCVHNNTKTSRPNMKWMNHVSPHWSNNAASSMTQTYANYAYLNIGSRSRVPTCYLLKSTNNPSTKRQINEIHTSLTSHRRTAKELRKREMSGRVLHSWHVKHIVFTPWGAYKRHVYYWAPIVEYARAKVW